MSRPPNLFKRVFLPVVLIFVLTAFVARLALDSDARQFFNPQFLQQWWRVGRVMELSHQNYLHPSKVAYKTLADSALNHMLDGLDRFTDYMLPGDYEDFLRESDQRFVGVGVEIERSHGSIRIYHVFDGSPAQTAKWLPGDRIVKVGDMDVRDFTVSSVADLLRGADNSTVQVTLDRPNSTQPILSNLTRGGFDVPNVRDTELRPDGVGYLRLTQFGKQTGQEFADAVAELQKEAQAQNQAGLRGLVLDLRDNPGGLLQAAKEVLEPLLPAGDLVVSTRGSDGQQDGSLSITGNGSVHFTGPLVVLVNNNSASASEIVAGALQDHHRAVILGERSYGKGVVQSVMGLPDGGGLRLTTEAYFLPGNATQPNGRTIQDIGITPDLPQSISAETSDLLRLERSDLHHEKPDKIAAAQFATSFGFEPIPDPEVETAAGLIRAATPNQAR